MTYINRKKRNRRSGEVHRYDRGILPWGKVLGPWYGEPDFTKVRHQGLIVIVSRNLLDGSLRGFVGMVEDHPLSTEDLDDLDILCDGMLVEPNLSEWHGENGLFRDSSDPNEYLWDESGSRTRWIGFDHSGNVRVKFRRVLEDCIALAGMISSYDPGASEEELDIDEIMATFEWEDE